MIKLNKKSFGKQHAKSFVIGQNFNYQLLTNDHLNLKVFGNNTMNTKKTKRRFNNYLGACNFIQRTSINSYCLQQLFSSPIHFYIFLSLKVSFKNRIFLDCLYFFLSLKVSLKNRSFFRLSQMSLSLKLKDKT